VCKDHEIGAQNLVKTHTFLSPAITTVFDWPDFPIAAIGAHAAKGRFVPHITSSSSAQRRSAHLRLAYHEMVLRSVVPAIGRVLELDWLFQQIARALSAQWVGRWCGSLVAFPPPAPQHAHAQQAA